MQAVSLVLQRENLRKRISNRQKTLLNQALFNDISHSAGVPRASTDRMHVEQSGAKGPVIDMVSDHDSEDTLDYSNEECDFCIPVAEDAACREAAAIPQRTTITVPVRVVPKTIENLWVKIKGIQATGCMDAPACTHTNCPYSSGPLMRQRYNLMCRLVELENFLYGV